MSLVYNRLNKHTGSNRLDIYTYMYYQAIGFIKNGGRTHFFGDQGI